MITRKLVTGAAVLLALAGGLAAQNRAFTPVTDEMLRQPPAADWLHWRRTSDGWGYSPLDQINRTNVGQLQMVWGWSMEPGNQQATPIVHDGLMFLPGPGGVVDALDAASGDLIWQYRHELPEGLRRSGSAVRGLSIYGNKVFLNTADARIVALDALTGKVVWNTQVADPMKGFSYSAGSLIARGKVISGLQGCSRFYDEKCSVTAHDAETGKEVWRVATIAKPGEPGGDTWGEVPGMFRAGGDMWITGSYDPNLNLIYWGVTQAKPWTRAARGTDGDALYTNSTLALDPETGKIVWYHQFLPGETQDMDDNFEAILVDEGGRQSLFRMGKLGILWQIDRRTGAFVNATDLGYQNIVELNPATGKVSYRPGKIPKLNEEIEFCPSFGGVKSWRSMAYHPETRMFYIPVELTCQKVVFLDVKKVEGGGGAGQGMRENTHHPASGGNLGEFIAMDTSGTVRWKHRQRAPFNSAALTTGGGLVFIGDWNRYMYAYDVKTGEKLWETRATTSPQGFPITYSVRGRQYLAVPIGVGSASWGDTIPTLLAPDLKRPESGNAIMVYALPETTAPASRP